MLEMRDALRRAGRTLRSHARPTMRRSRRWPSVPPSIEKHFTLSRLMYGSDARHSLEPAEFARPRDRRPRDRAHAARARRQGRPRPTFAQMKTAFEKSLVSRCRIPAGATIDRRDGRHQETRHRHSAARDSARSLGRRAPTDDRVADEVLTEADVAWTEPPSMRKVCVVVGSRANYSSIKSVMRAVDAPSRPAAPDRGRRLRAPRSLWRGREAHRAGRLPDRGAHAHAGRRARRPRRW